MSPRDIENADLTLADIPAADAPYEEVARFATTFNGYRKHGSFSACSKIAIDMRHDTLTELRTCLFFEQRVWHHEGQLPDARSQAYQRELVEKIRAKVAANERT